MGRRIRDGLTFVRRRALRLIMDARVKGPGMTRRGRTKHSAAFARANSYSHFIQPTTHNEPKLRRPCFRKARGAPGFPIPSLTRGMLPHKVRGAERRKARVTSIRLAAHAQCDGRSPRGAPLRRFSLDLETAFCERTGTPFTESP